MKSLSKNELWEENYNALIKFLEENNNAEVLFTKWPAQRSKDENEKRLAVWMMGVKSRYKENALSDERMKQLKKINFPFDPAAAKVKEGIVGLSRFILINKKLPTATNMQLFNFCKKLNNLLNV